MRAYKSPREVVDNTNPKLTIGFSMKIATAAYPLDPLTTWADYANKITNWVIEAAQNGAELLVFPEYASMELAMLAGPEIAARSPGLPAGRVRPDPRRR